ncbi:hypothetical protein Q8G50_31735, partial [Klebsiella pneumoniae]
DQQGTRQRRQHERDPPTTQHDAPTRLAVCARIPIQAHIGANLGRKSAESGLSFRQQNRTGGSIAPDEAAVERMVLRAAGKLAGVEDPE